MVVARWQQATLSSAFETWAFVLNKEHRLHSLTKRNLMKWAGPMKSIVMKEWASATKTIGYVRRRTAQIVCRIESWIMKRTWASLCFWVEEQAAQRNQHVEKLLCVLEIMHLTGGVTSHRLTSQAFEIWVQHSRINRIFVKTCHRMKDMLLNITSVSYTHLTLPTILRV